MNKTTHIQQLSKEMIWDIKEELIDKEVKQDTIQDALNGRLCDLEDTIDIKRFLLKDYQPKFVEGDCFKGDMEMDFTLLGQFKRYLNNQLELQADPDNIDLIIDALPFENYKEVSQESIYVVASCDGSKHYFYYNCYQILEGGTSLFEYEFYKTEIH